MKLNRSMIAGFSTCRTHMINDPKKPPLQYFRTGDQLVRYTMMPWVTNWEQELNRRLPFTRAVNGEAGMLRAL